MLIPAIIQDSKSKDILMMGYMNSEALKRTIKGPNVWFYSRSKKRLWEKGETSKNHNSGFASNTKSQITQNRLLHQKRGLTRFLIVPLLTHLGYPHQYQAHKNNHHHLLALAIHQNRNRRLAISLQWCHRC